MLSEETYQLYQCIKKAHSLYFNFVSEWEVLRLQIKVYSVKVRSTLMWRGRFGWDTHGLPVGFEIDKKLGIKVKSHEIVYFCW